MLPPPLHCGLIVNAYHAMAISLRCNIYFAHVRSHRNVSDPPSREAPEEAFDILERAGLERSRIAYNDSPLVPSLTDWTDPADVWADRVRSETARR